MTSSSDHKEISSEFWDEGDRVTAADESVIIYTSFRDKKRPLHKAESLMNDLMKELVTYDSKIIKTCESLVLPFVLRFFVFRIDWSKQVNRLKKSIDVLVKVLSMFLKDDEYQSLIKYWHDIYLCKVAESDQLPARNEIYSKNPIYTGVLKRLVSYSLVKKDIGFVYSLQKGSKRMWPRLGRKKMLEAYIKHSKLLSGNFPTFDPTIGEDLTHMLRTNMYKIFPQLCEQSVCQVPLTKFSPSLSACLQSKRDNLGCLGLFENFDLKKVIKEAKQLPAPIHYLRMKYDAWKEAQWRHSIEVAEEHLWDHKWISRKIEKENYDRLDLSPSYTMVQTIAIAEPSKFRMITKGDGFLYTALQPIQGALLDGWKHTEYATMRDEDLTEKVKKLDKRSLPGSFFCSVDYESATDYLKSKVSTDMLECIRNSETGELAYRSMQARTFVRYPGFTYSQKSINEVKKSIEYIKKEIKENKVNDEWERGDRKIKLYKGLSGALEAIKDSEKDLQDMVKNNQMVLEMIGGDTIETFEQKNGQLMGHPISFPLLCVANLSVYQTAYDRYVEDAICTLHMERLRLKLKFLEEAERNMVSNPFYLSFPDNMNNKEIEWEIGLLQNNEEKTYLKHLSNVVKQRKLERKTQKNNVIVNGDDMLFKSSRKFYEEFFIPTATEAGLVPSRGKNYFSESFAMINSQIFQNNKNREKNRKQDGKYQNEKEETKTEERQRKNKKNNKKYKITRLGYFNQKVLSDVNLKNPGSPGPDLYETVHTFNEMVKRCKWSFPSIDLILKQDRFKKIIVRNGTEPQPSYYIRSEFGGLGFTHPTYLNNEIPIKRKDRMIASFFICNPDYKVTSKEVSPVFVKVPKFIKAYTNRFEWIFPGGEYLTETGGADNDALSIFLECHKAWLPSLDEQDRDRYVKIATKQRKKYKYPTWSDLSTVDVVSKDLLELYGQRIRRFNYIPDLPSCKKLLST